MKNNFSIAEVYHYEAENFDCTQAKRVKKGVNNSRDRGIFPCHNCSSIFKYKRSLATHLKADCGQKKMFICNVCFKDFTYKQNLKKHMVLMHNLLLKKL